MRTVLLTVSEPFDQDTLNPSWEAVKALDQRLIKGRHPDCLAAVAVRVLSSPGPFARAVGDRAARPGHCRRTRARTHRYCHRARGNQSQRCAFPTTWATSPSTPQWSWKARQPTSVHCRSRPWWLRAEGIPASVSQTAGTFVCNQVFYCLQHALAGTGIRNGFIHVPYLPQQVALAPQPVASMSRRNTGPGVACGNHYSA